MLFVLSVLDDISKYQYIYVDLGSWNTKYVSMVVWRGPDLQFGPRPRNSCMSEMNLKWLIHLRLCSKVIFFSKTYIYLSFAFLYSSYLSSFLLVLLALKIREIGHQSLNRLLISLKAVNWIRSKVFYSFVQRYNIYNYGEDFWLFCCLTAPHQLQISVGWPVSVLMF
jgi:hypothetical protein